MIKTNHRQEDICALKTLGPWLAAISALIVVTVILSFYFADDIRQSQADRGQMQIGGFNVPGQMRQATKPAAKLTAFIPPWHGKQNPDAVTGATPRAMSFNQAIGIVSPSVVGIKTSGGGQQQSASGIIVNSRGYILTNNHVVKGAKNIVVTLSCDQIIKSYSAQIFDNRDDLDLAIIRINKTGNEVFSPAPLGDSDKVYIGQQIVTIGNPFGLSQSASSGIISNPDRTLTTGNKTFNGLIQTDAPINPGSSGSALVNPKGEVIGINTAIYSPTQAFSGISFAIPINQAKNVFPDLIEIVQSPLAKPNAQTAKANRNNPRAFTPATMNLNLQMMAAKSTAQPKCWLGIHAYPVDSVAAKKMGLPTPYGVMVNRVFRNSPAAKAGLRRGDVVFRVDYKRIRDENMLWSLLADKKPGQTIKIMLIRNNKRKILTVKMESGPINATKLFSNLPQGPFAFQANPVMPNASLPSPRQQNAAGKKFIEGHWLGLEVIPLTAELASQYQIPNGQTGVLVDEITLEAAESGILAGDMIQSIGGLPTPNLEAFFTVTQRERVWEAKRTKVGISRRGSRMTFVMTARNTNMLGFAQMEAAQPIQPGALRPHRYMGSCTNCHIFMKTGGQLATDAGDILPSPPPITKNATAPHRYRGNCATCHTIR